MFGVISKNPLPKPKAMKIYCCVSLEGFYSLDLTWTSVVYFELIFAHSMRLEVQLHSFACGYPVVEKTIISPLNCLVTIV